MLYNFFFFQDPLKKYNLIKSFKDNLIILYKKNNMTYITIDELNSNTSYAPLGFEEEFNTRIMEEEKEALRDIIHKLDTKKTLKANKIPEKYFDSITTLLDPYHLEDEMTEYTPSYRSKSDYQYYAHWDDYALGWKRYGKSKHREEMKTWLIQCFDIQYESYIM